eukprot:Em0010g633a
MPAFCKRDFLSSSLRVSTSFSIRSDGSPPLTMLLAVCISEHLVLTVLEQAAEQPAFTSLWHSAHWTSTSFSKITIALGADRIPVGTRVLSSEQQGHTGDDAATRSTTHLVQASLRHGSSRGYVTMFEQTTHFNSFRTVELFWLANGG